MSPRLIAHHRMLSRSDRALIAANSFIHHFFQYIFLACGYYWCIDVSAWLDLVPEQTSRVFILLSVSVALIFLLFLLL